MTLENQIKEMQSKMLAQLPDETVEALMTSNKKLFLSHIEDGALKAGDSIPEFHLINHLGKIYWKKTYLTQANKHTFYMH